MFTWKLMTIEHGTHLIAYLNLSALVYDCDI